jgi:hypothetical protein
VQHFSAYVTCLRHVENGLDNIFYGGDIPLCLRSFRRVLGIIPVHGCVHFAGGYRVEADPLFCVLDRKILDR